jgi:hypothetical protein
MGWQIIVERKDVIYKNIWKIKECTVTKKQR